MTAGELSDLEIRVAHMADVPPFVEHFTQHMQESGRMGSPHFATGRAVDADEEQRDAASSWGRSMGEPHWARVWLLTFAYCGLSGGKAVRIVGHLRLRGGSSAAEMHHAVLDMGIQRRFTGHRHGARLIASAIAWAREATTLERIHLGVFSINGPARKLYRRMGFGEVGVFPDAFRIDGVSIDDVRMALPLR